MDKNNDIELEFNKLISDKDLSAYNTYIQLTTYPNILYSDQSVIAANKDYASRDMTFPVDLLIKE